MSAKRISLYERLPEIYRIKDGQLAEVYRSDDGGPVPNEQLKSYLELVEDVFGAIHENIESLYHDLFIETCDDWVIPYIGDLLGTSRLSGDAWTTRADVADTIALRRRKGTLSAIGLLTYILTRWGVTGVELRENLAWHQHLNHQRPDAGGLPPYGAPGVARQAAIRGGTMTLRDPAMLSLLGTPFDPFAHLVDVRPHTIGNVRYNLPNLAIFLWRLAAYRLRVIKPFTQTIASGGPGQPFIVRVQINPIPPNNLSAPYVKPMNTPAGQPVRLFNTHRFDLFNQKREGVDRLNLSSIAPQISRINEAPGPIPTERLTEGSAAGSPQDYVSIETYDTTDVNLNTLDLSDVGLQLHLPEAVFPGEIYPTEIPPQFWKIRGANLCAWERGLNPPLADREIAIDPVIGRMVIGVADDPRATALADDLLITFTYGAVGPVGAHPISRQPLSPELSAPDPSANFRRVNFRVDPNGLMNALGDVHQVTSPVVIEIIDSRAHLLDVMNAALIGPRITEGGTTSLRLNSSLTIRAADNQRPIIELSQPLGFRPANVASPTANQVEQENFDAVMANMTVRLEGVHLARGATFPPNAPLIDRAALNRLELIDCTLDPGGFKKYDGARAPVLTSLGLREPYGFDDADEEREFKQTPEIVISRSVCGPVLIDAGYRLCLTDSIIDAGQGVDDSNAAFALSGATDSVNGWGPQTIFKGVTILGRTRVETIDGSGGIFVHALEVLNNQIGCIKFSYFSGEPLDRLPQNHGSVKGITSGPDTPARLRFNSEIFGEQAYCQLALSCDSRIREQGPNEDAMGAFGFLLEAHKWRNLQIRYREFMPIGARPLLIPVT
jgi:hypothetical protein